MIYRLYGVFHDASRRARSTSQGLVGTALDGWICETARQSSSNHPLSSSWPYAPSRTSALQNALQGTRPCPYHIGKGWYLNRTNLNLTKLLGSYPHLGNIAGVSAFHRGRSNNLSAAAWDAPIPLVPLFIEALGWVHLNLAFLVAVAMPGSLWIQAGRALAPLFPEVWGGLTETTGGALRKG